VNGVEVSTSEDFLWAFDEAGIYDVMLTVWDDDGASASDAVQVEVAVPEVTVSVAALDGTAGEPGAFSSMTRRTVSAPVLATRQAVARRRRTRLW
jgi:hypothetical protein